MRLARTRLPITALAAFLTLAGMPRASAQSALELTPANSVAFAHVKLTEVWNSEAMASLRTAFAKAGPKALAAMEEQLDPPPSSFETLTFFLLADDKEPLPVGVLGFNRPVDGAKIVKTFFPKAESKTIAGKTVYINGEEAIHFPNDRLAIFSYVKGMEQYLAQPVAKAGGMKAAIDLAASRPIVIAGNFTAIPQSADALRGVPPEIQPLLKAQALVFSVELQGEAKLHLAANYKDDAAAAEASKALEAAKRMAKEFTAKSRTEMEQKLFDPQRQGVREPDEYGEIVGAVMAIGFMNRVDAFIDDPGIRKEGASLNVDVTLPKEMSAVAGVYVPVMMGMLLPAVQKVREAAARTQSMNNLRQIGVAMFNYESATNSFPATAICDKAGKPLLSWRVAILPYIEQQALYEQFKLDEPWDSEHNKKLIPMMPKTYATPRATALPGYTFYKMFSGPETLCDVNRAGKISSVTDGLSNTILTIEGGDAVPWTKPEDIVYDSKKPLPKLGLPGVDVICVAMADGSVRALNLKTLTERTLRAAITANAGDFLGPDW